MEPIEYRSMFDAEESHWWYVGLRDLLLPAVRPSSPDAGHSILDAGCGTGRTLAALGRGRAFGLEYADEAFRFLRLRALDNVAKGTVCRLPFGDGSFDVVVSADVLCCLGAPGDLLALREFRRVLKPGGRVVLNLPAYPWLRGRHDEAVHIRRRYTRRGLGGLLAEAGLVAEVCTYRNTILFPVAAAVRLASRGGGRRGGPARSDLRPARGWSNRLLAVPLRVENRLIRSGLGLPFGLSVYAVARRG